METFTVVSETKFYFRKEMKEMEKDERKVVYGIRGKLVSAVAMLLVACIMVVSSTYAWFTLSTAPEVTGISTAVGANGALEMLLLTKDADGHWVYNTGTVESGDDSNTYWGNLVDLGPDHTVNYGVSNITLYPSELNGSTINATSPLKTPSYGADGRVSGVNANTMYGIYKTAAGSESKAFYEAGANDYGFRAIGVASGLTPRQLEYREAVSNISTLMSQARQKASESLSANGTDLAGIAVKKALNAGTFTKAEVESIGKMINTLKASLGDINNAYRQAILAFGASSIVYDAIVGTSTDAQVIANATTVSDGFYNACKTAVEGNTDIVGVLTVVEGYLQPHGVTLPSEITDGIAAYQATYADVNEADVKFNGGTLDGTTYTAVISEGKDEYAYTDFDDSLLALVDIENIYMNEYKVSETDKNTLINSALSGIRVSMPTGSGVYADIADQCGDYQVDIKIDTSSYGVGVDVQMNAKMATDTTVNPVYIKDTYDTVNNKLPASGDTAMPLTEFYGYVIDLAFKTNADSSDLRLQQLPTDRIYNDNNNAETMGHGSSMTFQTVDNSFSTDQMKALMENIRIVFFNTDNGSIYATAKLNMAEGNTITNADGVTAYMYTYQTVDAYQLKTTTEGEGGVTTTTTTIYFKEETTDENDAPVVKYYSDYSKAADKVVELTPDQISALEAVKVDVPVENNKIVSLDQNQEKHVSALVYLDGTTIDNGDVAATANKSMTGTVNFQFTSSATLVPMEYGNLHTPGESSDNSGN